MLLVSNQPRTLVISDSAVTAQRVHSTIHPGAYISENSTHYFLPDWAYLGQESCQNTVKEYSEHKIKAIFELSTLENPYIDSLFGLIYEFLFFLFFIF